MRILALETATSACSVGVAVDGQMMSELTLQVPRAHSTRLMPLIVQAVAESGVAKTDLDAIAVGVGPGSFTGLRIGLATAKGLGYALGKPCVGVPTLSALAYGTGAQVGLVAPMLDAKRGYLYTAVYAVGARDPATWVEVLAPAHRHVDQLAAELKEQRAGLRHTWQSVTLCGDAAEQYAGALELGEAARLAPMGALLPRAWAVAEVGRSLLVLGGSFEPEALAPVYLRKSEAETLWENKRSQSSR
jgi:tRNA threonylcarbamoyladenosine biosynthesis protein TsaB